jgi:glycosyltransferase involved in cell wall biosynthesis
MMIITLLTTDNRQAYHDYDNTRPWFGTAPQGLLSGFAELASLGKRDEAPASKDEPLEVHVVSCTQRRMKSPQQLDDHIWFHSIHVPKLGWLKTGYAGCINSVRCKLAQIRPDIVHAQGTERDCAMSGVFSGYPNVLTIHGNMRVQANLPATRNSLYYKIAALLEWFCLRRTNGVIAISNYTRDLVAPLAKRTWLLPNAVDPRFLEARRNPENPPVILFVGTFCERKNALGLLEACRPALQNHRCRLVFAGKKEPGSVYYEHLRSMAAELPNIEFVGFLDRTALLDQFQRCEMLVLPTREDNCPMVVLEAQAAGLPVAASKVGGIPDLIEHGKTGLLFDPDQLFQIRHAVEMILTDNSIARQLSANARLKAMNNYRPIFIARRHIEIYREVLLACSHHEREHNISKAAG